MKKVISLIILFLLIFVGCSKSNNRKFYRISEIFNSAKIEKADLNFSKGLKETFYYSSKNTTIPYSGNSSHFEFSLLDEEFSSLYFILDSPTRDKLTFRINTPIGKPYKNYIIKKGINEILIEYNFKKRDKIFLSTKNGNSIVISNPIFFKHIPKQEREYIFLISIDTLSANHMSLFGYNKETTPNISAFAHDAVVFDHAFSNSTWTVSSHMSLFTSLLEYNHKVNVKKYYTQKGNDPFVLQKKLVFPLSSSLPSLIEYLRNNYPTFSVNGGGNVSREFGFNRGFDLYSSNGKDMNTPDASSELFNNIKTRIEEYPFPQAFYFLHTYHTHSPYFPPIEYLSKIAPNQKLLKFDYYEDLGGMRGIYKPYPSDFIKEVINLYDAEISAFDSAFGDFIKYLKANDLYNKSTIIFLSDHGEEFLQHGSWVHASDLYNEQLRVPLIIKFPNQEYKDKIIRTPVSLIDVLPTLFAYKKLPLSIPVDGKSLLNLIQEKNNDQNSNNFVISSLFRSKTEIFSPGKISIISNNLKLIFSESFSQSSLVFFKNTPPPIEPFELYDISIDPYETKNILTSNKNNPSVRKMIKMIADIIRKTEKSFNNQNAGNSNPLSDELANQLKTLGYF